MGKAEAKEISRPTANRYLALVRAVLRQAAGPWQWIDKAPAVTLYPEAKRRARWLNKEQVSTLLNALPPQGVGIRKRFGAARVYRVGVENLVAESEEDAEAVFLTLHAIWSVLCLHLGKVSVVVFDRRNVLVERDIKVVIEVAAKRRIPWNTPPHLRFTGFELRQRSARNQRERCIVVIQVRQIA